MSAKLPSAERRTKAAPTQRTFGPIDHGQPVTLAECRAAKFVGGFRYEIVHGRLYVSPVASMPHDELTEWLGEALRLYKRDNPQAVNRISSGARVFVPGEGEETCPEPDLAAYRDFPYHVPLSKLRWEDVSPILVVEVVSGDVAKVLVRNVDLYARVPSIQEYWIVNQWWQNDAPLLRVLRRRGKGWLKPLDFRLGDTYTTKLLPGFRLLLDPDRR